MTPEDRLLFMKYALPCAHTLVERGTLSQETLDDLHRRVANQDCQPGDELHFKVAHAFCTLLAKRHGKPISSPIIREYFLFKHDEAIDKRFAEKGDFDPEACRTTPGRVLSAGTSLKIQTPEKKATYKNPYQLDLQPGDYVTVHWDVAVEPIHQEMARKMLESKHLDIDAINAFMPPRQ